MSQSHRPAAQLDAEEAVLVLEQRRVDVVAAAIVLQRQPVRSIDEQLVRAGGGNDQPRIVARQVDAGHVGDGFALWIERHRLAARRAVEPHAGDAAGEHPAQADVAGRDRIVAIDHPGEIDVRAVLGNLHVADVQADELLLVEHGLRRRIDDRHAPVAAGADGQARAVGRQGQMPRPAADVDLAGDFLLGQIDDGDCRHWPCRRHRPSCRRL